MTLIKDNLDGWNGHAALYSIKSDKPVLPECIAFKCGICDKCAQSPATHIIISSVKNAFAFAHGGPEVKAFRAYENGEPECMATFAELVGTQSHAELLHKMGLAWRQ
jgi:hypothetical protein